MSDKNSCGYIKDIISLLNNSFEILLKAIYYHYYINLENASSFLHFICGTYCHSTTVFQLNAVALQYIGY